jgi:hypothetical protein
VWLALKVQGLDCGCILKRHRTFAGYVTACAYFAESQLSLPIESLPIKPEACGDSLCIESDDEACSNTSSVCHSQDSGGHLDVWLSRVAVMIAQQNEVVMQRLVDLEARLELKLQPT